MASSGQSDIFIAKYDGAGNFMWAKSIGGAQPDNVYAMKVTESQGLYITGTFSSTVADFDPGVSTAILSTNDYYDCFIARYDNNGNYVWAKSFGSNSNYVHRLR